MLPFDPNQLIPLIGMVGGMVLAGVVLYASSSPIWPRR